VTLAWKPKAGSPQRHREVVPASPPEDSPFVRLHFGSAFAVLAPENKFLGLVLAGGGGPAKRRISHQFFNLMPLKALPSAGFAKRTLQNMVFKELRY
jgi:hypothetical protein